jgi:hypothetical protein
VCIIFYHPNNNNYHNTAKARWRIGRHADEVASSFLLLRELNRVGRSLVKMCFEKRLRRLNVVQVTERACLALLTKIMKDMANAWRRIKNF